MTEARAQVIWIPGKLPGINQLLAARASYFRQGRYGRNDRYNVLKADWQDRIRLHLIGQGVTPIRPPAYFLALWFAPSRRVDPDNLAAAGRKFVLDTLVLTHLLPNDGWDQVGGWSDLFLLDAKQPGLALLVSEGRPMDRHEAAALFRNRRTSAHVSLREAARRTGVAASTICAWEGGRQSPPFERAAAYLEALDGSEIGANAHGLTVKRREKA